MSKDPPEYKLGDYAIVISSGWGRAEAYRGRLGRVTKRHRSKVYYHSWEYEVAFGQALRRLFVEGSLQAASLLEVIAGADRLIGLRKAE